MRIYLDEDVDVLLGTLLKVRGFDCLSASQAGHLGWTDEQHLHWAGSEDRLLISHNRVDFQELAKAWYTSAKEHAGILLVMRRANSYELLRRVLPLLGLYDQTGWRNVVMYA